MAISFDDEAQVWRLTMSGAEYVVGFRDGGLYHLGFGPPSGATGPTWEVLDPPVVHSALHSTWTDAMAELRFCVEGEPTSRVELVGHEIDAAGTALELALTDGASRVAVRCRYELHEQDSALTISRSFQNLRPEVTRIGGDLLASAWFPTADPEVETLFGDWGDECHPQRTRLPVGEFRIGVSTGKQFTHLPWFALTDGDECWWGTIAYSGNWQVALRRDMTGRVALSAELRPEALELQPNEVIALPAVTTGYEVGAPGEHSTALARLASARHPRTDPLPVVYDHYFPFHPDPPGLERMERLARLAAEAGCEVFLLDAGWHRNEYENDPTNWQAARGDWVENEQVFPDGLEQFAEFVRGLGMEFGIWIEPESATATSAVVRQHPEWLHTDGDGPLEGRGGAHLLRFDLPEVQDWAFALASRLIDDYGATWLKWDFNTELGPGRARRHNDVIGHVAGVYEVWRRIAEAYPDVVLENCASGGGRLDHGAISHADVTCLTDRMTPTAVIGIRFGAMRAFPLRLLTTWLVHWPEDWQWMRPDDTTMDWTPFADVGFTALHGDLDYRARAAMLGTFGISSPLDLWDTRDLERLTDLISAYKAVRSVIAAGTAHPLTDDPPRDGSGTWAAIAWVAPDGGRVVVIAFRFANGEPSTELRLTNLRPKTRFEVVEDGGVVGSFSTDGNGSASVPVQADAPYRSVLIDCRTEP